MTQSKLIASFIFFALIALLGVLVFLDTIKLLDELLFLEAYASGSDLDLIVYLKKSTFVELFTDVAMVIIAVFGIVRFIKSKESITVQLLSNIFALMMSIGILIVSIMAFSFTNHLGVAIEISTIILFAFSIISTLGALSALFFVSVDDKRSSLLLAVTYGLLLTTYVISISNMTVIPSGFIVFVRMLYITTFIFGGILALLVGDILKTA